MIYLDHAATTPTDKNVFEKMLPFLTEEFYNPSLHYRRAVRIRSSISEARMTIAEAVGAKENEILFTCGGTEGNNLAIKGAAFAYSNKGKHIITTEIEHPSVLNSFKWLEKMGFEVSFLKTDASGRVSLRELESIIRKDTVLVSVMYVNNETGAVQPVKEIAKLCHENNIVFHTDAVQAFGHVNINVRELDADLMTVSGHKLYGPKGSGFLFIKDGISLDDYISGGEQEKGIRPGTENVASVVGLAEAVRIINSKREERTAIEAKLSKKLCDGILKIEGSKLNGEITCKIPAINNFGFEGIEGESLLMMLDTKGIYVSTGSACAAGDDAPSYVLTAMGNSKDLAKSGLRISLGYENTEEEIDFVIDAVKNTVEYLRSLGAK